MKLSLIAGVAALSVLITCVATWRLWTIARTGAPREVQVGYLAIMVVTGIVNVLLLRQL